MPCRVLFHPPIHPCRNFVYQLRRISSDAGMPVIKDPFCQRYVQGLDNVEPLFRQLRVERPDLQLIMVVLPGKTPVYGESSPPTYVPSLSCLIFVVVVFNNNSLIYFLYLSLLLFSYYSCLGL